MVVRKFSGQLGLVVLFPLGFAAGQAGAQEVGGESTVGEWKFLSLPGGPVATTNLPFLVSWQERCVTQTARVNMVAFRVVPVVDP